MSSTTTLLEKNKSRFFRTATSGETEIHILNLSKGRRAKVMVQIGSISTEILSVPKGFDRAIVRSCRGVQVEVKNMNGVPVKVWVDANSSEHDVRAILRVFGQ